MSVDNLATASGRKAPSDLSTFVQIKNKSCIRVYNFRSDEALRKLSNEYLNALT